MYSASVCDQGQLFYGQTVSESAKLSVLTMDLVHLLPLIRIGQRKDNSGYFKSDNLNSSEDKRCR
jgi:hypothetical protein